MRVLVNGFVSNIYEYNVLGEQIGEFDSVSNNLQIDIASQPAGTYFIKIKNDNKIETKRIVLTR